MKLLSKIQSSLALVQLGASLCSGHSASKILLPNESWTVQSGQTPCEIPGVPAALTTGFSIRSHLVATDMLAKQHQEGSSQDVWDVNTQVQLPTLPTEHHLYCEGTTSTLKTSIGQLTMIQHRLTSTAADKVFDFPFTTFVTATNSLAAGSPVFVWQNATQMKHDLQGATSADSGSKWYLHVCTLSFHALDEQMDMQMDMGNHFCNGMSMIMAMGGFQWSLANTGDCLNYFTPSWKLDSSGKFQGAMFYSFMLAFLTEGLASLEIWLRQVLTGKLRKYIMAFLYGVQQWMGYLIMLVAMMYSVEQLISVLCGLMMGHVAFGRTKKRNLPGVTSPPTTTELTPMESTMGAEQEPLLGDGSADATVRRRR